MEIDSVQGLSIILFVFALYFLAFFAFSKGRLKYALLLIVFTGFGLRLFCSLDPMLHAWDERYHALVAKNTIENPFEPKLYKKHHIDFDYKNWAGNEIWLHKQPIPIWSMAISMKLFGMSEFSVRLPSLLLSTLSILLTFFIGRILFSSQLIGLIAAFLQSINGLIIEISSGRVATDHIDTFFLFFIELSLFFIIFNLQKKKPILLIAAGISCGLAILTKWLPALIVLPLFLILNYQKKSNPDLLKELFLLIIPILIVSVPWQIYAFSNFPIEYQWEQNHNLLHLMEGLDGHGQPWWYFINKIRIVVNELIYLILIWFAYFLLKRREFIRENLFLLVYFLVPFCFFSFAQTKMQGYLLFSFPAYFIIFGLFFNETMRMKIVNLYDLRLYRFRVLFAICILILALRYGIERVKPFDKKEIEKLSKTELINAEFPPNTILFNAPCPIEIMFYTDCIAYKIIPDNTLVNKLVDERYKLHIIDNGTLPARLYNDTRLVKIKLPATLNFCQ